MALQQTRQLDLEALRSELRGIVACLAQADTHAGIEFLCQDMGLADAPIARNKAGRGAGAVDETPDDRLEVVATKLLARDCVNAHDRNRLQDLLWASSDAPVVVKRHRREVARALAPDDLYLKVDPFDRLISTLFVIDPPPSTLDWLEEQRTLHDDIRQHVYRNPGDWSTEDLFEKLEVLDASDKRFALFIEGLVSPDVRPDEANQRQTVQALNQALGPAGVELRETGHRDGYPVFALVRKNLVGHGRPKRLIFASSVKPDLRFIDAISGNIEIVTNADRVLVYEEAIGDEGLRWRDLERWWRCNPQCEGDPKKSLYKRLKSSLPDTSPPQLNLFVGYHRAFSDRIPDLPALIPEVWLHWDPKTVEERGALALTQHRMDFLMLLPHGVRVVVEVDGKQHYASSDGMASVKRYATLVQADRELQLSGYYVFRFGASELPTDREPCISTFFSALFARFGVPTTG